MRLYKYASTKDMEHAEWLQQRRAGIGGSDAGAICGLNPYSTAITVFLDKTGQLDPVIDNEAMRQGRDLEDYVAKRFFEETRKKVKRANAIYYNPYHPFMIANVDRLIIGENAGLECKTASAYSADKWANGEIPAHYEIQCHHYMAVTGADAWYIACVILGKGFVWHKIERDSKIIGDLVQIEECFWKENVLKNHLPDADGSKVADEIINKYYKTADEGNIVQLPENSQYALNRRLDIMQLIDKLTAEKSKIEQDIKLYMQNAEGAETKGFSVSWKNYSSNRVDTARLKKEFPEVYKKCCKNSSSRRFVIKQLKEEF